VTAVAAEGLDSENVAEVEAAVSRLAYLLTRTRRHERIKGLSGLPLDRAGMVVLRQLDEAGVMRLGELAALLHVEAPHVTRQVQLLERKGYACRRVDPDDKRAQRIEPTVEGKAAADRLRAVSRAGICDALGDWSSDDLHQLATLLGRMVDAFLTHAAAEDDQ
jgi:DNA-binding MarR family transcriptional regulator